MRVVVFFASGMSALSLYLMRNRFLSFFKSLHRLRWRKAQNPAQKSLSVVKLKMRDKIIGRY